MAENMYEEELSEMLRISEESVRALCSVWTKTFDQDMCQDNLRRLFEHTKNYYNDLIIESMEKKAFIENAITELHTEADNLRRLLKTDVHLPQIDADEVPLLVIQREMDKSLTNLRKQLHLRHEQIQHLLLEQETLCEELGEPPRPLLADPLPTATEVEDFRSYLENLKEERDERTRQLLILRKEIKNDLQILELNVNTDADDNLLNQRHIKLSKETFEKLRKLRHRFASQVEDLKARIDTLRQKLPSLWNRLNTPYEERRQIERYSEYNQVTHDILVQELNRCEEIKRKNLKFYIQKLRAEIEIWWDMTLKSEVERNRFAVFNSHDYTDELLTLHEMELEDLKQYYEENREIFELYSNRLTLWQRMTALEEKSADPARYNNRGGQLLKEEKERRTIATKLPKIEQQIRELVEKYQEREHTPFLVHGKDILQFMDDEWTKKKQDKEAITTARKKAITPNTCGSNRSQLRSVTRTPLSQKNVSSSIYRTPSASSLSTTKNSISTSKRKIKPSVTIPAKRSLWMSPGGVFLKPPMPTPSGTTDVDKIPKPTLPRKKPPRVIGTTIRRLSERLSASGAIKKRRSIPKSGRIVSRKRSSIPDIIVNDTEDDNYDDFMKCIEPDSRSSIRMESTLTVTSNRRKAAHENISHRGENRARRQKPQLVNIHEDEQDMAALETMPQPQLIRTPSKQNLYPLSPGMGTSSRVCSSRKLTTKNLPILI